MVSAYRTKELELPDPKHRITRIDLILYGVDHSGSSYEGRVFIGRRKPQAGAGPDHHSYAGSFYVFGHGSCQGEAGHCDVPTSRDPFDCRLPHHLEPHVEIVTVTDPVLALVGTGVEKAPVTLTAHDAKGEPVDALDFTTLRLVTYA